MLDLVRGMGKAEPLELKHKRVWGLATRNNRGLWEVAQAGIGWGGVRWKEWDGAEKCVSWVPLRQHENAFRCTKYVRTYARTGTQEVDREHTSEGRGRFRWSQGDGMLLFFPRDNIPKNP